MGTQQASAAGSLTVPAGAPADVAQTADLAITDISAGGLSADQVSSRWQGCTCVPWCVQTKSDSVFVLL